MSDEEYLKMVNENLEKLMAARGYTKEEWEKRMNEPAETEFPKGLNPDLILVGKNIRAWREERGWSIEQLAVLAEIPATDVAKMETGDSDDFPLTYFYHLSCVFEIPTYRFYLKEDLF